LYKVCVVTNWLQLRIGLGKFNFNDININGINLCSHIIFSSVTIYEEDEIFSLREAQQNDKRKS
jgi:hypothetical protein